MRALLEGLVAGTRTREEANDWAAPWVREDPGYADVEDEAVLNALDRLFGADLQEAPGQYLHGTEDFQAWLAEFDADCQSP
ncbi:MULTISPECIES: hypothetical protein [Actinomadura]|uniref:CdiI immunity protein domain-containing protein n=1 Tax=Actinomadura yumaensis TaxID=111807 RepID=A0ABW2CEP6_9ACTN|nr:hypothetical protein [Actinomadura sp. J1-007]